MIFAVVIQFLGGCTYKFNSQEPIWYIDPPAVEGSTIVSGYGKSKHKQLALDMATMAAKRTAADMIASEVKGKSKYYLSRGKKIDKIITQIQNDAFFKATLGGCIIEKVNQTLIITKEI